MINIFTDSESLVNLLPSLKSRGSVSILDLTGNEKVKKFAGDCLVPPVSFSQQEKKRIMDEYIEAISDIGALNHYSLQWLCHPMSEKNDLLPNNLFDQLIDFLSFYRVLSHFKQETLVVLAPDAPFFRNIMDYLRANRIDFGISGSDPAEKGFVRSMGAPVKKVYSFFKQCARCQYWFLKSRFVWKRVDKTKTYTIIRTWFDSRSPGLIKKAEDVYFGRFPGFLKEKGHHILYFGEFGHGFEHEFDHLKTGLTHPVIFGRSLIHGIDFLKGYLFLRSVKRKIRLIPGLRILDIDVDIVFNNYFQRHALTPHIRTNYFSYLAVVKLVKKIKIDRFFMPFENYAWEKLSQLAIAKYAGNIRVAAFQHAQVALNASKFFLGKKESLAPLLPDKIVTLGEITKHFLINQKNYPAKKMVTGCALRQDYSITTDPVERKKNKQILVQLWSFERSVQMVNFINASKIHLGKDAYEVTLNPHPCHPMKKLIPHLDFQYKNDFNVSISTESLTDRFRVSDLVIYHGTTTCLDALANGLPVINVEFDDFISVDPLFDFNDFKWSIRNPEELHEAIEKIYALSDKDYYKRQKKGFEFVKRYFYPVNEENLKKFL